MLAARRRRRPAPPTIQSVPVPAPVGGLNLVQPSKGCLLAYNLIASEYGLRTRLGHREWVTGITGAADNQVRTVLPFTGGVADGSGDRSFVTTSSGIWDVSASAQLATEDWAADTEYEVGDRVLNDSDKTYVCVTAGTSDSSGGPTGTGTGITDNTAEWDYAVDARLVIAFGTTTGDAGYGVSTGFVTSGGHFLVYTDEVNGMYVYTESTATWSKVTEGVGAGQISGVDPADFVYCTAFKNRLWLVERNTANVWYLAVNAIFGAATSLPFAGRFRAGGDLVGIWNWSLDGGAGIDDHLVGISRGGDVVIYQLTDPTTPAGIALKGTWYAGGLPAGRHIASDSGGDLLILTKSGILPLSRLVAGAQLDGTQYTTRAIAPLFNQLMLTRSSLKGWSIRQHPEDNALMVTVPTTDGANTEQLVMSLAHKSWTRYRELPIFSAEVWGGKLYFGTSDGRVCINDGYVDAVLLSDPDAYTDIGWSLITAFSDLGNGRQKQIQMIRPTFLSDGGTPNYAAEARYRYNLQEVSSVPVATSGSNTWDTDEWDAATWSGDYSATQAPTGAAGVGVDVAVAIKGTSRARTVLVKFDVMFTQGGIL